MNHSSPRRELTPALYWGLVLIILIISLNLRPAITSLGPVSDIIQQDTGMSTTLVGLLASVPVFCFGIGAWITPRLVTRFGIDTIIWTGLLVTGVTTALRSYIPGLGLWLGTVGLGLAIGLLNGGLPAVIKRDFPKHTALVMGLYSACLTFGAGIASDFSVPLAEAFSWHTATGIWTLLAVAGLITWGISTAIRRKYTNTTISPSGAASQHSFPKINVWTSFVAWTATIFMGMQSMLFYTWVQWLPDLQKSHGISAHAAGTNMFIFQLAGIAGTFILIFLQGQKEDQRVAAITTSLLWIIGLGGLIFNPGIPQLWAVIMGLGGGASFTLALSFITARTCSTQNAAELSGMVQSIGYILAATGPALAGTLAKSYGWSTVLLLTIAVAATIGVMGIFAGQPKTIDHPVDTTE